VFDEEVVRRPAQLVVVHVHIRRQGPEHHRQEQEADEPEQQVLRGLLVVPLAEVPKEASKALALTIDTGASVLTLLPTAWDCLALTVFIVDLKINAGELSGV
jgi:hypothetical protein